MSDKVSIEREELEELRYRVALIQPSAQHADDVPGVGSSWQSAMSMLNAMIGKAGEEGG